MDTERASPDVERCLRLPREHLERLRRLADQSGESQSTVISVLFRLYLPRLTLEEIQRYKPEWARARRGQGRRRQRTGST